MEPITPLWLIATFVAVEGAHAFSAFNPSIFTIREFKNPRTAKNIRIGEALASAFCLLLGGITSMIALSLLPLVISAIVAALMCCVYEWALMSNRQYHRSMATAPMQAASA